MSKERGICCHANVCHPYERVRDALHDDPLALFQAATRAAASRAESIATRLHFSVAGIELESGISISITDVIERPGGASSLPVTQLQLEWEADRSPRLFPIMRAALTLYPVTMTETGLDFSGLYEPPLGLVGGAMDTLVGHRIAERSVRHFLTDVSEHLQRSLAHASAG